MTDLSPIPPATYDDLFSRRVELKFTVSSSQADEIRDWAIENMGTDMNLPMSQQNSYRITSLYLDTPQLDIFHRNREATRKKHRLRRYDSDTRIWLETKRKSQDLVRKKRSSIDQDRLEQLVQAGANELQVFRPEDNDSEWFRERIFRYRLRPVTWIEYERFARVQTTSECDARLTIDSNIRCLPADSWTIPDGLHDNAYTMTEMQQLELKFCNAMPMLFKQLMQQFQLIRSAFSKYRTSVTLCRLDTSSSLAS